MAFGVKVKNITTNNAYTIESLFEAIKDKEFSAGKPSLTKHGAATIITFPALDSQNQVWVMGVGFKSETKKFSIQKNQEAGVTNMLINNALDSVTGGLFGFNRVIGTNAKECERLVEETAKELNALGL